MLRLLRRDRRGTSAPEFAIIGGLLFVILLGAADLARYYVTMHSLRTVAADAGRAAIVAATSGNGAVIGDGVSDCGATAVRTSAQAGILGNTLSLSVTCPNSSGITTVNVRASRPFNFVIPILGTTRMTLTEDASFRFAS